MNWSVFFAVITWAVTVPSVMLAVMSVVCTAAVIANDSELSGKGIAVTAVSLVISVIGIATIGGMGWIN